MRLAHSFNCRGWWRSTRPDLSSRFESFHSRNFALPELNFNNLNFVKEHGHQPSSRGIYLPFIFFNKNDAWQWEPKSILAFDCLVKLVFRYFFFPHIVQIVPWRDWRCYQWCAWRISGWRRWWDCTPKIEAKLGDQNLCQQSNWPCYLSSTSEQTSAKYLFWAMRVVQ